VAFLVLFIFYLMVLIKTNLIEHNFDDYGTVLEINYLKIMP